MSQRLLKIRVVFGRLETPGNSRYITDEGILTDRISTYLFTIGAILFLTRINSNDYQ